MINWNHLTDDPNGGSTGEAFFNTLNNNGFTLWDRLAREGLQNSRDAANEGKKLSMEFRFVSLEGHDKKTLVDGLNLDSLAERKVELGLKRETCLEHLHDNSPMRLLYVSDYNTSGLYGNPRVASSHLRRLLLTLGDRKKQREGKASGGSYGFGKAVYSASSKIHTIVAYSRFDDHADDGINSRLMGCGYFQPHTRRKIDYSGRAIFGRGAKDPKGRFVVEPAVNDQAHALAKKLGFEIRGEGQSGSSILIIDPQVHPADLVAGIETWWWPALVEQSMDVVVLDENKHRLIPKPKQRADLRPFIESFYIATGVAEPVGTHQTRPSFNRIEDVSIGSAGLVLLDSDVVEKGFPEERLNSVALIRGPRMVVQYHPIGGLSPYIAGAFVGSDDIEIWLKASEPPAHDVWDSSSPDVSEFGETASKAVRAIHIRLKSQSVAFRKSASPPPSPNRRSLKVFENILGRLFKAKQPGPPPPPPGESAPIRIEFKEHPKPVMSDNSDKIHFLANFDVRLRDDFPGTEAELKVFLDCTIVEEEDGRGDPLPLNVTLLGPKFSKDEEGNYVFTLEKNDKASFAVNSDAYEAMWSVRFTPTVELVSAEAV